jgi:hypothetical protein
MAFPRASSKLDDKRKAWPFLISAQSSLKRGWTSGRSSFRWKCFLSSLEHYQSWPLGIERDVVSCLYEIVRVSIPSGCSSTRNLLQNCYRSLWNREINWKAIAWVNISGILAFHDFNPFCNFISCLSSNRLPAVQLSYLLVLGLL